MNQKIENPFTKVMEVNLFGPYAVPNPSDILAAIINFEIIVYSNNVISIKNRVNNCEEPVKVFDSYHYPTISSSTIYGRAHSIRVAFNSDSNKCECINSLHCIFEYNYVYNTTFIGHNDTVRYLTVYDFHHIRKQLNIMFESSPLSFDLVQVISAYETSMNLDIKYNNHPVLGYAYTIRLQIVDRSVIFTLYHQHINWHYVGHLGVNKLGIFIKGYNEYFDEQKCLHLLKIPLASTPTQEQYELWFMFVSHLIRYATKC